MTIEVNGQYDRLALLTAGVIAGLVAVALLAQPFRADALSYLALLYKLTDGYKGPFWIPFLAAGLAASPALWRSSASSFSVSTSRRLAITAISYPEPHCEPSRPPTLSLTCHIGNELRVSHACDSGH
jgi:hypothetical protein